MKNIVLTLMHVSVQVGSHLHYFTFLTTDTEKLQQKLAEENTQRLIPFQVKVLIQERVVVRANKDKLLHNACSKLFADNDLLRYEELLPFDGNLDQPSVAKNILFDAEGYQPQNEFEVFLAEHDVLKSYYQNKICFTVKSETEEHSREFGSRNFVNEKQMLKIDPNLIKGIETEKHSHVYHARTKQQLVSIQGVNDKDQRIHIDF